jgi:hypothetical protein
MELTFQVAIFMEWGMGNGEWVTSSTLASGRGTRVQRGIGNG